MEKEKCNSELILENEKKLKELSEEYFFLSKSDTNAKSKVYEEIIKIQQKLSQLKKVTN